MSITVKLKKFDLKTKQGRLFEDRHGEASRKMVAIAYKAIAMGLVA